ncbi:hypothetical protein ABZW96_36180 [Nocardia sp. NPDC004168]|uniref:hypothetical protein n=1 Tax=Nocardia sp. NPDC004168 TaxID=3154452 RepID=UPI0033B57E71
MVISLKLSSGFLGNVIDRKFRHRIAQGSHLPDQVGSLLDPVVFREIYRFHGGLTVYRGERPTVPRRMLSSMLPHCSGLEIDSWVSQRESLGSDCTRGNRGVTALGDEHIVLIHRPFGKSSGQSVYCEAAERLAMFFSWNEIYCQGRGLSLLRVRSNLWRLASCTVICFRHILSAIRSDVESRQSRLSEYTGGGQTRLPAGHL